MLSLRKTFMVGLCLLGLTACSGYQSPISLKTQHSYRDFNNALFEAYQTIDYKVNYPEGRSEFALSHGLVDKVRDITYYQVVLPERVEDYELTYDQLPEFYAARLRLTKLFDAGGRHYDPLNTARAQASFDCWLSKSETWAVKYSNARYHANLCRATFQKYLAQAEDRTYAVEDLHDSIAAKKSALLRRTFESSYRDESSSATAPSAAADSAATASSAAPMTASDMPQMMADTIKRQYIIYFDFDKVSLDDVARAAVQDIAADVKGMTEPVMVHLVGHTDTSGTQAYNRTLSERRAGEVKKSLVTLGIAEERIRTLGKGESDLAVHTPDNVRARENRRVEATLLIQ